MRLAVAGEEALQPQHVGAAGVSDDDRAARAALQQPDAAQDQRAHDALAELGLLHHQVAQPLRADDQRLDRLERLGIDQRGAGRELRQLADELARPVRDDGLAPAEPAILGDLDLARQDDDQAGRDLAGPDDVLARGIGTRPRRSGAGVRCRPRASVGNIWSRRAASIGLVERRGSGLGHAFEDRPSTRASWRAAVANARPPLARRHRNRSREQPHVRVVFSIPVTRRSTKPSTSSSRSVGARPMNRFSREIAMMPCTAENSVRARTSRRRSVQFRPQHRERRDQILDQHCLFCEVPFGRRRARPACDARTAPPTTRDCRARTTGRRSASALNFDLGLDRACRLFVQCNPQARQRHRIDVEDKVVEIAQMRCKARPARSRRRP